MGGLRGILTVVLALVWQSSYMASEVEEPASWKWCGSPAAAFRIEAVDMQPTVISPGGSLKLVMSGTNQHPVTASQATVTVYYYGIQVLTASDTLCTAAASTSGLAVHESLETKAVDSFVATNAIENADTALQAMQRQLLGRVSDKQQHLITASAKHLQPHEATGSQQDMVQDVDVTCTMPAGPVQLQHVAILPGIAPKGRYSMRLAASDAVNGQELMCVDVWFKVA